MIEEHFSLTSVVDRMPNPSAPEDAPIEVVLRGEPPMAPNELIELGRRTRDDLERGSGLVLAPLEI